MDFAGKTVVVTGGASGIGAALVRLFVDHGACVAVLDLSEISQGQVLSVRCDVSDENSLKDALAFVENKLGFIDIFVSNAGVLGGQPDHAASGSDLTWSRCWQVNVMAHVYAARHVLPPMLARGSGYFVTVASAAGLLNQIGDAAYSATKHAAVSFAESLSIAHGDAGIGVSLVCPQYVATPMIGLSEDDALGVASLLTAEDVAACVLTSVSEGRFLVLPHPEVRDFAVMRAKDHDQWIQGMRRLKRRAETDGLSKPTDFYRLV